MKIDLDRSFLKDLKKLDKNIQQKFYDRVTLLLENPFHPLLNNHTLHGVYAGFRSINISGDIRALYLESPSIYMFSRIGTHSQLYD